MRARRHVFRRVPGRRAATLRRWSVAALLLTSVTPASAQGLFDAVTNGIVDAVNQSMGVDPPPEVRRLQGDAARVALRGNADDWDRFVQSAVDAVGEDYRPAFAETRSVAQQVDRVRGEILGRTFGKPGYQMVIVDYAMGTPDPTGQRLPIVVARSTDGPDMALLYVMDPDAAEPRYWIRPGDITGWPGEYPRTLRPGTPLDLNGDGIDEIFWVSANYMPKFGEPPNNFFQTMEIFAWRTPENEAQLAVDWSADEIDDSVKYVGYPIREGGYSTTVPNAHRTTQDLLTTEVIHDIDREHLLLTKWEWPLRADTGLVAMPQNFDAGPGPIPWDAGRKLWTKEALLLHGELTLVTVATYAPEVTRTDPGVIVGVPKRQWIALLGEGFEEGAQVTFFHDDERYDIPADRTEYVGPTSIRVYAGIFPVPESDSAPPDWSVMVTNPDGTESARRYLATDPPP